MGPISGDEKQDGDIVVEETNGDPSEPVVTVNDNHHESGKNWLVQNGATTNSFQQFFGKGVTSAADSAKELAEINDRWTDEYADIPTLVVRRMSSSDDKDSDTDDKDVIASNQSVNGNIAANGRAKHIDTRMEFIREYVDDGTVEIKVCQDKGELGEQLLIKNKSSN